MRSKGCTPETKKSNVMYAYSKGFAALLSQYLCIAPQDQVLIIYDEGFVPYMESMVSALGSNRAYATFCFLPTLHQQMLVMGYNSGVTSSEIVLPSGLKAAITNTNVIINMLSSDLSYMPVRKAIVNTRRQAESKLAHIPGITPDILRIMEKSPIREIEKLSEMVAWAIGEARNAELITRAATGEEYTLRIGLDGWITEPIMSSGVIKAGSWGNAVPGETFCCPDFREVDGEICINGSIPGLVLGKKDQIVLTFDKGKMVNMKAVYKDSPALAFFKKEKNKARRNGDQDWDTFAELGIGLNPAIKKLTGVPVFDEKLLGTIHIAIGDNSAFGHNVRSKIHADLVVSGADLSLEGKKIIVDGELRKQTITRWRNSIDMGEHSTELHEKSMLMLNHGKLAIQEEGIYRLLSKSKRLGYVKILDETHIEACNKLQKYLPEGEEVVLKRLMSNQELVRKNGKLKDLIQTLHHYNIMMIKNPL